MSSRPAPARARRFARLVASALLATLACSVSRSGAPAPAAAARKITCPAVRPDAIDHYRQRARAVRWLPGTLYLRHEPDSGCLRVGVRDEGTRRLARLVLRGAGVPRRFAAVHVVPAAR
ncbi:MAG TPA: hypothetical protein VNK43_13415 [Gemmatimonadales bacterium]|nr:hypothetical protein [Gemmatimonadales bacterium]